MRESKRVQLNAFTAGSSSCLVSSGGVMGTVIFFVQVATPIYRPAKPVELLGARWCKKRWSASTCSDPWRFCCVREARKVSHKYPTLQVMMIVQVTCFRKLTTVRDGKQCQSAPKHKAVVCPDPAPAPVLLVELQQCCRKAARKNHRTKKSLSVGKGATPEKWQQLTFQRQLKLQVRLPFFMKSWIMLVVLFCE